MFPKPNMRKKRAGVTPKPPNVYCELCGTEKNVEGHHVFYGTANRRLSEQYGLKMWLCAEHHRGTNGIHNNREMDLHYKKKYQRKFETEIGAREEFINLFGRNYL